MKLRQFPPTRAEALRRLSAFVPYAGSAYASGRNTDNGPHAPAHVSLLSPYVRHRLITEREIVAAVLAHHSMAAAEKYIQEILWRTYWKGWLEMRPAVWSRFIAERDHARDSFSDSAMIIAAESGTTGIDGFDDWARELVDTGYLHNHARMWFASIWIFTLRLPWTLGADFFLRHLIDADAASNILSWRWVAGLHTAGKTYLATADNISRYTNGRFAPTGLAGQAIALVEAPLEPAAPLPDLPAYDPALPAFLLVTHEDMNPESIFPPSSMIKAAYVAVSETMLWGQKSRQFVAAAAKDTADRIRHYYACDTHMMPGFDMSDIIAAAQAAQVKQIITPYTPVGPVADALKAAAPALERAGLSLFFSRRSWDTWFWPQAKKGFFPFKEKIRAGLLAEGIDP